jgi:DNA-binding HxlR family transcriptional regulator
MVPLNSKPRSPSPLPGTSVRGSRTGRPVMAVLDLLGRRGALRILWELRDGRSLTFRRLQTGCGEISSSVLNDRLHELRDATIVELEADGYRLTTEGHQLLQILGPLDDWAKRQSRRIGRRTVTSQ